MRRINVYATDDEAYARQADGKSTLIGHFDLDACTESIEEGRRWDGNNMLGIISGLQTNRERVLRTRQGRWVLHHDARSEFNGPEYYAFLTDDRAKDWLLRAETAEAEEAVEKYFGEIEEEAGPNLGGRPEIGKKVETRLDPATLASLDARAAQEGVARAEMMRRLVVAGLQGTSAS